MNGKINLAPDLFLGTKELNQFQEFLREYSVDLLRANAGSFGLVKVKDDNQNIGILEIVSGTSGGNLTLKKGMFIDINMNVVHIPENQVDVASVTDDGTDYYVKIKYLEETYEEGTVSVDSTGNVSGTGTLFTENLRGGADAPSVVEFDSLLNTASYEVVNVTNDTTMVIQGNNLSPQSGLRYRVRGTFTPGVIPSTANKYPFRHSSYQLTIETGTTLDTGEYLLAKVNYDSSGSGLIINDARVDFFSWEAGFEDTLSTPTIANIGIESVKYGSYDLTGDFRLPDRKITVGWGFRCTGWNGSHEQKKINITSGLGGRYTSISDILDDDFDGYNVYFADGSSVKVVDTFENGGNPYVTLETYPETLPTGPSSDNYIVIAPDAERVEILVEGEDGIGWPNQDDEDGYVEWIYDFPISRGVGMFKVTYPESSGTVHFKYRLISGKVVGPITTMPNGSYNNEDSFNEYGEFSSSQTSTVTSGLITFKVDSLSIGNRIPSLAGNNSYTGVNTFTGKVALQELLSFQHSEANVVLPSNGLVTLGANQSIVISNGSGYVFKGFVYNVNVKIGTIITCKFNEAGVISLGGTGSNIVSGAFASEDLRHMNGSVVRFEKISDTGVAETWRYIGGTSAIETFQRTYPASVRRTSNVSQVSQSEYQVQFDDTVLNLEGNISGSGVYEVINNANGFYKVSGNIIVQADQSITSTDTFSLFIRVDGSGVTDYPCARKKVISNGEIFNLSFDVMVNATNNDEITAVVKTGGVNYNFTVVSGSHISFQKIPYLV